jgi:MFS family permease
VPLIDMKMMRLRGVWTTNLVAALFGMGMYASFVLMPELVQEPRSTGYGFGASVTAAGLFLLPSTIAMVILGQFAGALDRRFGSKPPLLVGSCFAVAAYVVLAGAHEEQWEIYVASGLLGIGIGLAFAAMANLIVQNVRPDQTGAATGMNTVTRTIGGAFGGQVAASVLASSVTGGHPTESGYVLAFVICAAALCCALIAGLRIPARRLQETN